MKVLFITIGTVHTASSRLRVYNYLPLLNDAGIENRVLLAPQKRINIILSGAWKHFLWADVIFVQKATLPVELRLMTELSEKSRVFDLDDALFALPNYMVSSEKKRWFQSKQTHDMAKWADFICVSNKYLARYALMHTKNVVEIPTAIDCDKFYPIQSSRADKGEKPVLGWVGAADNRHFENVKLLVDPLKKLARKKTFTLRIIGIRKDERFLELFKGIPGITVEEVEWKSPHYIAEEVRKLDVGLSPMLEDRWTLGKNPVKVLEYMASGIVVVASRVGTQREFISDGVNGFLASSPDEWVEKLGYALGGSKELDKIRREAVNSVREKYSVDVCGRKLVELLDRVAGVGKKELRLQRREK